MIRLILFLFVAESFSLKCWDCRSYIDSKCRDPFDNSTFAIKNCNFDLEYGKHQVCVKLTYERSGNWEIIRKCHHTPTLSDPCSTFQNQNCEWCNTKEGCNKTALIKPTIWAFLATIIVIFHSQ